MPTPDAPTPTASGGTARARSLLALVSALSAAGAAAWAVRDVPVALGSDATGTRAERVRRSPHFRDGKFHNPETTRTLVPETGQKILREYLFGARRRRPSGPVPVVSTTGERAGPGPHLTWYGHSSALVEVDGARVLVDPLWSDRCSPSTLVGPRRLHPPPVPLSAVPRVDAILISHDHYDHLDMATVRALASTQDAPFLVPLGVGAHLDRWRVPAERIVEVDWGDEVTVAGLRLVATPARHFSGRAFTRDRTQWVSWVVAGPGHRVFYSGDSGYFDGYAAIGAEHGPFDATLMQVGAYNVAWPDIHMFPEDVVTAHLHLRGGVLVPVHWGTFDLALHPWAEPIDRLEAAAEDRGVTLCVPRPGAQVAAGDPPPLDGWWRAIA